MPGPQWPDWLEQVMQEATRQVEQWPDAVKGPRLTALLARKSQPQPNQPESSAATQSCATPQK